VEGLDDVTGEPLFTRADDTKEALAERLRSFNAQTYPIIAYYEKKGALKRVNASAPIKDVETQI
jgi:adenylate kinase